MRNLIYVIHYSLEEIRHNPAGLAQAFSSLAEVYTFMDELVEMGGNNYLVDNNHNIYLTEVDLPAGASPKLTLSSYDANPTRLKELLIANFRGYPHATSRIHPNSTIPVKAEDRRYSIPDTAEEHILDDGKIKISYILN